MKKYHNYLLLPLLVFASLFSIFFLGTENVSAGTHIPDIVNGATVTNTTGTGSGFSVSLNLADGYEDAGGWGCWLPTAETWSGTPSEIHVEHAYASNGYDYYNVYLLPAILPYYGQKNYGATNDTCTQKNDKGCLNYQSVNGLVRKKKNTPTPTDDDNDDIGIVVDDTDPTPTPDPDPPSSDDTDTDIPDGPTLNNCELKYGEGAEECTGGGETCTPSYVEQQVFASSSTSTEDYYLTINYLKYGTTNSINSCGAMASQGPYRVTTTTTNYDIYSHDQNNCGGADTYLRTESVVSKSAPQQASVNPPASLCDGKYKYVSANPGTGPFSMSTNQSVNLFYAEKHSLTVTPKRFVNNGYSNFCSQQPQTTIYYDNDDKNNIKLTSKTQISCSTGTYDFYEFRDKNNVTTSGQDVHPADTTKNSSTTGTYRRQNTLLLKHVDFYSKSGGRITNNGTSGLIYNDQSKMVHDNENATITPANNFKAALKDNNTEYEYRLIGYANSRNDQNYTADPNPNSPKYTRYNMTSDATVWAFYKKVININIIPIRAKDGSALNTANCKGRDVELSTTALQGDTNVSVKTCTTIDNYTFKGFTTTNNESGRNNPSFPSSYTYTVSTVPGSHVTIYAVYETVDDIPDSACAPQNGNLVQSYVRNTRFDSTTWSLSTTYAKPGDKISFCTGYNNKYPYWNFMYPDYDYLVAKPKFSNLNHNIPLGYQDNLDQNLKKQLYTGFSVTSNQRNGNHGLQYTDNPQLSFTKNRNSQQSNFKSTKRAVIKDYPNKDEKISGKTFSANTSEAIQFNTNNKDVGSNVTEQGHINTSATTSINTYTSVSYIENQRKSNPFIITSLDVGAKNYNTAQAIFPYNFMNTSTIIDKGRNHYVYAGGITDIDVNLIVNPKENKATHTEIGGKYATIEKGDIYYRIEVSVSDGSTPTTVTKPKVYSTNGSKPINSENKVNGDQVTVTSRLPVPDVDPGTLVCFRSSIWPKDSDKDGSGTSTDVNGGYTSVNEAGSWSEWGPQVCYKAASKPNLQAWGGNVIANGQISTSYNQKYHLYSKKYYPDISSYKGIYNFGSWGELGIIANRDTYYMASGAALAYPQGMFKPNTTNENTLRSNFVPLTFANYDPLNPATVIFGNLKKTYTTDTQTFDKNTLINKYIYNTTANIGNTIQLTPDKTSADMNNIYNSSDNPTGTYHNDNNVLYYRSDSNLAINSSTLAKNITQVIHAKDKNIRISGNIIYDDNGGYTTLENIPKLIVYAENGTISIDWQVTRIDAILIADTIITCSKESGCTLPAEAQKASDGSALITNPNNRRNQLTINGTVITQKVIPNRTYGAGKGAGYTYDNPTINSITPAEIFNYDASLYRWEQYSRTRDESISPDAALITTYIKEVAPRY